MAEIHAELARVHGAYAQPTLTLLGKQTAPVIVAVLRTLFTRDVVAVPALRLHDQVDALLVELRLTDEGRHVPVGSGKDVCSRWMRDQWLSRTTDEAGAEVYVLTSHTQQALRLVESLMRDRATNLSEHRIATIMNHLRRFNSEVNPNRGERIALLNEEIARLALERDRLLDGGELGEVTDDHLLEGFVEAMQLLDDLPGDFARVVETFAQFRTSTIERFNAEEVTSGEVVHAYLAHAERLTTATPEGRAFAGAFQLLRDDEQLERLRSDIDALLSHPRVGDILNGAERADLRSAVTMINDGLKRVLDQRIRVSGALRDYISRHDVSRDRELAAVLRDLESELGAWMQSAGPRRRVPVELIPGRLDIEHLKERFYDPADDIAPAPLTEHAEQVAPPTLEELRLRGGPSHRQLAAAVEQALAAAAAATAASGAESEARAGNAEPVTLGAVFNALPADLRRPVEVLGLFPLVHQHPLAPSGAVEVVETVRPDGSTRRFEVPTYVAAPAPAPDRPAGPARSALEEE